MTLQKETGCKVLSETRQGENKPEDVSVGTSIWNYKACYGSHLFSSKRNEKSGWGGLRSFVWDITWKEPRIFLDFIK